MQNKTKKKPKVSNKQSKRKAEKDIMLASVGYKREKKHA